MKLDELENRVIRRGRIFRGQMRGRRDHHSGMGVRRPVEVADRHAH